MQAKTILFAGALALAGSALTGCVETGPAYGGYHHSSTVYVRKDHRRDHDRDRDRDYRHTRDHDHDRDSGHDRHRGDDHHMSGHRSHSRVDCRRDPHNRACRHH